MGTPEQTAWSHVAGAARSQGCAVIYVIYKADCHAMLTCNGQVHSVSDLMQQPCSSNLYEEIAAEELLGREGNKKKMDKVRNSAALIDICLFFHLET